MKLENEIFEIEMGVSRSLFIYTVCFDGWFERFDLVEYILTSFILFSISNFILFCCQSSIFHFVYKFSQT